MAKAVSHFSGKSTIFQPPRSNPARLFYQKHMVVSMAQNQSHWAAIEDEIEAHLKEAIPIRHPVSVFEPMHHLTFAAPRTTAPALCIAACELVGGKRAQAIDAASALHLIHAAAYAHEHLPLTDRARPKPTIEHKFNPNIELLTGDGIVPFGFEILARSMTTAQNHPDRVLRAIIEITQAAGSQGMVDGQYREHEHSQSDGQESPEMDLIEYVSKKKEGELNARGAACGAILGGGSEEEIERLRKYGLYVGTIQGMLYGVGRNKKGSEEIIEKLKGLAREELEALKGRKVELISSFLG